MKCGRCGGEMSVREVLAYGTERCEDCYAYQNRDEPRTPSIPAMKKSTYRKDRDASARKGE